MYSLGLIIAEMMNIDLKKIKSNTKNLDPVFANYQSNFNESLIKLLKGMLNPEP